MTLHIRPALLLATILVLPTPGRVGGADPGWAAPYFQYRLEIEVDVARPGWHAIPLSEITLCEAISQLEEYSFDPRFVAYDQVQVTTRPADGDDETPFPSARYSLIVDQKELVRDPPTAPIPTRRGDDLLVRFTSEGGRFPPTVGYEQVFPVGEPPRTHAYLSSYVPRLLPRARTEHECLLRSDGTDLKLVQGPTTVASGISVRACRIVLEAEFARAGRHRLVLYYQPTGAHYLKIPARRRQRMPTHTAKLVRVGLAEKNLGDTRYRLPGAGAIDLWFADTTVKLTRRTQPPQAARPRIQISTAAHEAQSFQLVMRPRSDLDLRGISVSSLSNGDQTIDKSRIEVRQVEFVPIRRRARINQVSFFGEIADPLVPVKSGPVNASTGNRVFWVTVRTPAGTSAGIYRGAITLSTGGGEDLKVPLAVEVFDFALPEFSTFRSHMGGQYLAKKGGDPTTNPVMAYHGLSTKPELKKLATAYYETMAREKFYPKSVALFAEIGMRWKPPPKGYNVSATGNFFELTDWDFREFNATLEHFIDRLKVNSVCLAHTNPSVSHVFKHLPGDPLETFRPDPGHTTMAWQTFRRMTQATYSKKKGDPWFETSVLVTRDQWDRLVLDYYRKMARNLKRHGWLKRCYVFVDETAGTDKILHLVRLLKSDPETRGLQIAHCLQGFESLRHRENGEFAFSKLLTHVPQVDENYYRWEDYFWDDYEVPRSRDRLWSYAAYSSRLGINVPGMTNREIGLEVFNIGGSGYAIWDTFMWHHPYGRSGDDRNPWVEPYARLANGALSYFYPPTRRGLSSKPDYTITPSLRVMTFRESVDDYEYARILEDLVSSGLKQGVDVARGRRVLADIRRMFPGRVEWTLNDAWYLDLRERMARAIVDLRSRVADSE